MPSKVKNLDRSGTKPQRKGSKIEKNILSKIRLKDSELLFTPRADWFNVPLPAIDAQAARGQAGLASHVQQIHQHALSLLEKENEHFATSRQDSSSQKFFSTVVASGTLSDKVSALTLAVQESPVHNVRALESLIALSKKRSRTQVIDVLRALKDLFAQGSLLPSNRRLYTFATHPIIQKELGRLQRQKDSEPLTSLPLSPDRLIVCAYENWLKEKYFEILTSLEVWCNDEIEFSRSKATRFVFELLKEKPEQEANLLRLLTNKLGDPSKKIASQASYLLMEMMSAHPLMKMNIITSIESDVLFRPGQNLHAKYYAAITLNQTALSGREEELARKLLDIYFGLFVGLLKPTQINSKSDPRISGHRSKRRRTEHSRPTIGTQEDETREKLVSAVLTGINRAYPFVSSHNQSLPAHLDTLFKVTHSSNFNTSIQALMLIQQLCSSHQVSEDRFYRTLYESLLDPRLLSSSKHSLYLNLLHRALKADLNAQRVTAFVKRIFQVLHLHQPPFICGCISLVQELKKQFPSLTALVDQAEDNDENFNPSRLRDPGSLSHGLTTTTSDQKYDSRKRDPEHSNAANSCLWEAVPLLAHFHPSVAVNSDHLMRKIKIPGKTDLELHTLMHFLDRFIYRNAKAASTKSRGSSIMQPTAANDRDGVLVSSALHRQLPVNSEEFWSRQRKSVAAEDIFFHQYFNSLGKVVMAKKSSSGTVKAAGKAEGHSTEDNESEIWNAMMESAPDLERLSDSEQDLEMSDLDSVVDSQSLASKDDDVSTPDKQPFNLSVQSVEFSDSEQESARSDSIAQTWPAASVRRRRLKKLPTFAAASDFAAMVEDERGEDLGPSQEP